MPSKRVRTIRRAIVGIPALFIGLGYLVLFVTDDTSPFWTMVWVGVAVTVLFVLWHLTTLVDERIQSN